MTFPSAPTLTTAALLTIGFTRSRSVGNIASTLLATGDRWIKSSPFDLNWREYEKLRLSDRERENVGGLYEVEKFGYTEEGNPKWSIRRQVNVIGAAGEVVDENRGLAFVLSL